MATVLDNTASNQFIVSNTYLKQVIKDLFYWYRIALIFLGFITQRLQQNSFMISIKYSMDCPRLSVLLLGTTSQRPRASR